MSLRFINIIPGVKIRYIMIKRRVIKSQVCRVYNLLPTDLCNKNNFTNIFNRDLEKFFIAKEYYAYEEFEKACNKK